MTNKALQTEFLCFSLCFRPLTNGIVVLTQVPSPTSSHQDFMIALMLGQKRTAVAKLSCARFKTKKTLQEL